MKCQNCLRQKHSQLKGKNSENRFTSLWVKGSRHFEATFVHFLNFLDAEDIN